VIGWNSEACPAKGLSICLVRLVTVETPPGVPFERALYLMSDFTYLRAETDCCIQSCRSSFPSRYQCLPVERELGQRWAAFVLLSGQCAASVEELVSLHDVQAYRQTSARTVGASSEFIELLERHRPAGGTATPAGGPFG
jgi:hypothetical protein